MHPHLAPRRRLALGFAVALTAAGVMTASAQATPNGTTRPQPARVADSAAVPGLNGPYLYLGWGNPPQATDFLKATGTTQLTMAFILAKGGCEPAWDGQRALAGGRDERTIKAVQAAGGSITPSIGGWSGSKLGEVCRTATDLAGAYQKVIDAYKLDSIDIDIESTEVESEPVRQRVIDALKILKDRNRGLKVYVTFGTAPSGPIAPGRDLVRKGAKAGLDVDGWTVMPFDFGDGTTDMVAATKSAVDGLKNLVATEYKLSSDAAYRKVGFSSMNGKTDVRGEVVTPAGFREMVNYAKQHHLARVSFWAVNRDRPCAGGGDGGSCSGIDQKQWEFSKILAGYQG